MEAVTGTWTIGDAGKATGNAGVGADAGKATGNADVGADVMVIR